MESIHRYSHGGLYDLRETQYNLNHPDTQDIQETPRDTQQIFMALRDENRCLSADASAYILYQRSKNERTQRLPKEGDLIVVRSHAVDSQKGRKLEGRWLGPRLLVSYTISRLSAYVREVHRVGKPKRYHLDDIILYNPRSSFRIRNSLVCQGSHGTTPAVIGSHGSGEPGSRAVFSHFSQWGLRPVGVVRQSGTGLVGKALLKWGRSVSFSNGRWW